MFRDLSVLFAAVVFSVLVTVLIAGLWSLAFTPKVCTVNGTAYIGKVCNK